MFAGTAWGDSAAESVATFTFSNGVVAPELRPEQPLSVLRGESANGTWTLRVVDDLAADTGMLIDWSVILTTHDQVNETANSFSATPDAAIGDAAAVESALTVTGIAGSLCGLEVETNITHTYSSDLTISLEGPDGTIVVLSDGWGSSNDDVFAGTTWSDLGAESVTTFSFTNGVAAPSLIPEEPLTALLGKPHNGNWKLHVVDNFAEDDGTLNSWGVHLTTCTCD